MLLHIKTLVGKYISVEAEASNTIGSVKLQIQTAELIPVSQQLLFFDGTQLEDDKPLADFSIGRDDTIRLIVRLPPAASEEA